MAQFDGQLQSNTIFAAIYNMIISQRVFADNIKGTYGKLARRFKVDGTLYGDTKLYYSTDVLKSTKWGNDAEATNLLALHRPDAPKCQKIVMNIYRQISLTVDKYLTKQAWATEGAFTEFTSVMEQMMADTKKVYDATTMNAYIGTTKSPTSTQNIKITFPLNDDPEKKARLQAQTIAEEMANLISVDLQDISRDFNDYGFLRSYDYNEILVVWNSKFKNKILKIDLPTIFHNEDLIEKFSGDVLPSRYFGTVNTVAKNGNTAIRTIDGKKYPGKGTNGAVRALVEMELGTGDDKIHYFPGDAIADGVEAPANKSYTEESDKIICKVMHPESIPFMSGFEVGTSFFNPKSLTENRYLTWGHNTLQYLSNYPFITITGEDATPPAQVASK